MTRPQTIRVLGVHASISAIGAAILQISQDPACPANSIARWISHASIPARGDPLIPARQIAALARAHDATHLAAEDLSARWINLLSARKLVLAAQLSGFIFGFLSLDLPSLPISIVAANSVRLAILGRARSTSNTEIKHTLISLDIDMPRQTSPYARTAALFALFAGDLFLHPSEPTI